MKFLNNYSISFIKLLSIFLFWIIIFSVLRFSFIVFHYKLVIDSGANTTGILKTFYYALPLDISTASYFTTVSWFFILFQTIINFKIIEAIHKFIIYILIAISSLVYVGEMGIYGEWKTKLNFKALVYLKHPAEVIESDQTFLFVLKIILVIGLIVLFSFVYNKFFDFRLSKYKIKRWIAIAFLPTVMFLFIGARGGVSEIPISQSKSYFSTNNTLNDIAVNSVWNLIFDISKNKDIEKENIFKSMPDAEAKKIVEELHKVKKDTTIHILKVKKPNIILIILESFSADLIHSLGGKEGITPNFEKLQKDGLLFTHCYSSGNRSQQGMASIFGGFPALPITTLTTVPEKMRKTAVLIPHFNKAGYQTAFYFGGQLEYGNIKAYMLHNKFSEIYEGKDFYSKYPSGKLGVHDEYMLHELVLQNNKKTQPFFSALFTLSSHSPYDQPIQNKISWGDTEDKFLSSAYYTDYSLGKFFEEAKKQKWYKNTLFILVADHSHNSYRHWAINQKEYRHIPMLFYGEVLKDEYKGYKYTKVCSQTDITKTLLKQLDMNADEFFWSKNLFNPYSPEFAYFELNQGFGWIKKYGYLSYDHFNKRFFHNTFKTDSLTQQNLKEGSAYLQVLFQEYIDL